MKKWLVYGFVATLILISALNLSMLVYGFSQLKGQIKVLWQSESIDHFLEDPDFPDSLKQKIRVIQDVKRFASDSLGLDSKKQYEKIFDQKQKGILWVVTAAPEFSLEAHKWSFPFLGELEYKGYFDSSKASIESERMRSLGYDVNISEVEAWSTLGFFSDPILSKMLDKEEGMLARLIIHELTHGAIYIKSDAEFNENLATFIGNEGAKQYLLHAYGPKSNEYELYIHNLNDIELFTSNVLEMRNAIEALYQNMQDSLSIEEKRTNKALFFRFAFDRLRNLPFENPERFRFMREDEFEVNNTFFSGLNTYHSQQDSLKTLLNQKHSGNLKAFIQAMKAES